MKQLAEPLLFSIESAANYLGVSKRTVEQYIHDGQIRTYRLPAVGAQAENLGLYLKKTLIHRSELERFVNLGQSI